MDLSTKKTSGPFASLFEPVDIAWLVFFRIGFGALMLWESYRYLKYGWIEENWIKPTFHFAYPLFAWVRPWPGEFMYHHFLLLCSMSVCIAAGFYYRLVSALFFLGFTYVFLLDRAQYLNHFYLISLLCLLMAILPANRAFSLDARWDKRLSRSTVPAWMLYLMRFQIAVPYFFGGIAKLNGDWLRCQPMRMWMADRTNFPLIGRFFTDDWMVYLLNYGGLALDLFIVPALLWRRSRPWAFALGCLFHLMNYKLFHIGVFPWMMILGTLLFFKPDWPRRLMAKLFRRPAQFSPAPPTRSRYRPIVVSLLAAYVSIQCLVPLRHLLYPGEVNWTEEGHCFSWHMMLRTKKTRVTLIARDDSGNSHTIDPSRYLSKRQLRKMSARPYMLMQFAHHLAGELEGQGYRNVQIHVQAEAALNGRPYQQFIDPEVDLSKQRPSLLPASWITPLHTPLPTAD